MINVKLNRKRHQAGISLLEVLLSLSIIAIILVMATRYFFVASNNDRINSVRQQVGAIVAAIHSWKDQNPQYNSNLSVSSLYQDGFLAKSSSLVISGTQASLYNPWGQQISISSGTESATIQLALPKLSDCKALQNSFKDGTCSGSVDAAQFSLVVR
ncbi:MAG: prepilin-type N-terminal cleavage/methylation domain-containing protein [Gammaproteobacteria bacterium]|nr:prepilin-type N-terminal cleavage/methylation domain-containing protein [Gammaproteobacteria bacterium]